MRKGGDDGTALVNGVVCESQGGESIDVIFSDEPKESLCGSIRLDVRISDASNQKMLKGLQNLLMYSKSGNSKRSSPVVDVAFGRKEPYLVRNRGKSKLSCGPRDAEVQRGDATPRECCVINCNLNEKQSEAVDMALAMDDIGIIHG